VQPRPFSIRFKRIRLRAAALLLSLAPAPLLGQAAPALTQRPYPNHYIVLIDASGSAVSKRAYQSSLDLLIERLYGAGFGDRIPAFRRGTDQISLFHFGIVAQGNPCDELKYHDFVKELVHPDALVQRRDISRVELTGQLWPRDHYRFTFLTWARQMALFAAPPSRMPAAGHTFLIVLTDNAWNNGTSYSEIDAAWSCGEHGAVVRATRVVDDIDALYRTFPCHSDPPLWSRRIPNTARSPMYLDANEVRSDSTARWEADLREAEPLQSAIWTWTGNPLGEPTAEVAVTVADRFLKRLKEAPHATLQLSVAGAHLSGHATWQGEREVVVPVRCTRPYHCQQEDATLAFAATLTQTDLLLGTRTYDYKARRPIAVALPFRCSLPFYISIALTALAAIATLAGAAYVWYYRTRETLITVKLAGSVEPVRLRWGQTREHSAYLANHPVSELMRANLPSHRLQALIYRGARFAVVADGEGFATLDGSSAPVVLPIHRRKVAVLRALETQSPAPRRIILTFTYRGRIAAVEFGQTQDAER
jgi:hypothetical protein